VLVVLMIAITVYISPYAFPSGGEATGILKYFLQVIGFPFVVITLASIPVVIVCWFIKVIPDIDYSIRTAFVFMLFLLAGTFMG